MRKYYILFLMFLSISCEKQSISEKSLDNSSVSSRKQTEDKFIQTIHGTPLIIPLPAESDPTLFLMPVSDSKDVLRVDRLYLVDCLQDKFRFERDIYEILWVVRMNETEESAIKYIAVVSSIITGTQHEYEIDGFMMHQIWKINNDKWKYKSNIKIPIKHDCIRQ